jgi:imidazolonepropionase-like amidohydrolase
VGQSRKGTFALVGGAIETITKGRIERGTVVIRDGKIAAIGADVQAPADAEVIDCSGLTIYPGLIDAGTELGLIEIGSLAETRDNDELGEITPQVQALTAVNPNSVSIPVTRVSGVTTVLTAPSGGLFPGTAALINLIGYTPEQMHVGGFRAVTLDFPKTGRRGWWDDRSEEDIEKDAKKAKGRLKEVWERAVLYAKIDSAHRANPDGERTPEYVPELQALAPVVRGEIPLMIEVDAARDIDSAIAWVKANKVRAIFAGVSEGWRVADKIAAAGIPCIVGPVLSIPTRPSDRYDKAYANPGLLRAAGVKVAIRTGDAANVRNLPYHAGFAAAYGMGREEALRAVTIAPAEIFGVDKLLGSVEQGKQATLFIADGDPFEPATQVRHIFIDGYRIPMESRHVELYQEFIKRVPGVEK